MVPRFAGLQPVAGTWAVAGLPAHVNAVVPLRMADGGEASQVPVRERWGASSEAGAVADLGEDPLAGARPDAGQGREDLTERVSQARLLDLLRQGIVTSCAARPLGDGLGPLARDPPRPAIVARILSGLAA